MVRDGIRYALALTAAACVIWWLAGAMAAAPLALAAAFCLYFFRDPERAIPEGELAVSPADGKVLAVTPQPGRSTCVSIFMNVFDVHVNRAPVAGRIAAVHYRPGRFHIASTDRAVLENEQNSLLIEEVGGRVVVRQIAGLIARRIVCWKKPGDEVRTGERIGLIKFGSRVDVSLGPRWRVVVRPGQRVKAGSTILALPDRAEPPSC